jgi:hypothetical protein
LVTALDLPLRPLYHLRRFSAEGALAYDDGKAHDYQVALGGSRIAWRDRRDRGLRRINNHFNTDAVLGRSDLAGDSRAGHRVQRVCSAATTLLTAAEVQSISGDPSVAALAGACTSTTCVYSDTTGTGGGGGVIFVQPFPGAVAQSVLQAAIASALSGQTTANGGTATSVSGLGSGAIKEIDTNSATYAFVKDNYLVVINVTSGAKSGADMDSQVGAAAQTIAGSV